MNALWAPPNAATAYPAAPPTRQLATALKKSPAVKRGLKYSRFGSVRIPHRIASDESATDKK